MKKKCPNSKMELSTFYSEELVSQSLYQIKYNPMGITIPTPSMNEYDGFLLINLWSIIEVPSMRNNSLIHPQWKFRPHVLRQLQSIVTSFDDTTHLVWYTNIKPRNISILPPDEKHRRINELIQRIKDILYQCKFPCTSYISIHPDQYHKPNTALFTNTQLHGRLPSHKIKYMVGCDFDKPTTDHTLACRLQCPFIASPYYFQYELEQIEWILQLQTHPFGMFRGNRRLKLPSDIQRPKGPLDKIAVLLMGPPASGKSTIAKWMEHKCNFRIVSQDRGIQVQDIIDDQDGDDFLKDEIHKIVIDSNNTTIYQRNNYISQLKKYGFGTIWLIEFRLPLWLSIVFNKKRERQANHNRIHHYYKIYQPIMKQEEGITYHLIYEPLHPILSSRIQIH